MTIEAALQRIVMLAEHAKEQDQLLADCFALIRVGTWDSREHVRVAALKKRLMTAMKEAA